MSEGQPNAEMEFSGEQRDDQALVDGAVAVIEQRGAEAALKDVPARLHMDVALKMIDTGNGFLLPSEIEHFKDVDYQQVAERLFAAGKGWALADHLEKFPGLDHNQIATRLIEARDSMSVVNNQDKFHGLSEAVIVQLNQAKEKYAA